MEKKLKAPIQYNNCPAKIKAKLKKIVIFQSFGKNTMSLRASASAVRGNPLNSEGDYFVPRPRDSQ